MGNTMMMMSELLDWDDSEIDKQWSMLQEQLKSTWDLSGDIREENSMVRRPKKKNQDEPSQTRFYA